jgi:UDP-N-acetylglucosamine acyltransferase
MGSQVHPTAILGPAVELGTDTVVGPFAVLTGPCRIGDRAWIGAHTVIGAAPEIRGHEPGLPWGGETAGPGVEVGDDTTLREFTAMHRGTHRVTRVGNRCLVLNTCYIAHDVVIDDDVTLSPHVTVGGHAEIGAGATIGMAGTLHQRRLVGPGAMVGMGAVVTRDVPPYAKAYGSPARVRAVNDVGMRRRGISEDDIAAVAARYGSTPPGAEGWTPPESLRSAWAWWHARAQTG